MPAIAGYGLYDLSVSGIPSRLTDSWRWISVTTREPHDLGRAAAGQPPLTESLPLDAIASIRARQMVTDGLTHVRPGRTVMAATELLQQNGVTYTWNGENIFWAGGPPFDEAVSDAEAWWMNSPEHRDNILGSHFRQVGIGTAIDGGRMYIAAVFTD